MKKISKRNTLLFYIVQFCNALVFTIPIWVIFLKSKMEPSEFGILLAAKYAGQLISELPTGAIADIFGKKVSIALGFIIIAIATALMPFAPSFIGFLILSMSLGVGDSFLSGAMEAFIFDSLKQDGREAEYSKVMAKNGVTFQIGLIIATFIGGIMGSIDIRYPYFAEAASSLAGLMFTFMIIEPKIDTEKFTIKNYFNQIKLGTKELFKNSHIKKISIFYIIVGGITWSCMIVFNNYLFVELGFKELEIGNIFSVIRLVNIILITRLLRLDKIFTRTVSFMFFPVIMIVSLLPGILLTKYVAIPFVAGAMIASTARWIILGKYTNQEFDSKYRSTAISALSMFIGFLYIGFMLASGPIIEIIGTKGVYSILGLLSLFVALPLGLIVVKEKPKVHSNSREGMSELIK